MQPTVFADVTPEMTIAREEIFGPVLAVIAFDDVDEAIAHRQRLGLRPRRRRLDARHQEGALRRRARLEAGTVWINTYNVYDTAAPFGGYKQSGFGREMGPDALDGYPQTKSVWVDLSEDKA